MTYNARQTDEAYFALFSAMEQFRQGPPVYILPLFQALSCSLLSIFLSFSTPPSTFPTVFQSRATEQSRVVGQKLLTPFQTFHRTRATRPAPDTLFRLVSFSPTHSDLRLGTQSTHSDSRIFLYLLVS
jgi:hypothetical protein